MTERPEAWSRAERERIASDVIDHALASPSREEECAALFFTGCMIYGTPEFLPKELR